MTSWAKAKRQARRIKDSKRKKQAIHTWAKHVVAALQTRR